MPDYKSKCCQRCKVWFDVKVSQYDKTKYCPDCDPYSQTCECGTKFPAKQGKKYCSYECYYKYNSYAPRSLIEFPERIQESLGVIYEPRYEMEVIFIFAKLHMCLALFKRIKHLQPHKYPDGILQNDKTFEFELLSSNFILHKHDPECIDYLICWEHDLDEDIEGIHILELKKIVYNDY